MDSRPQPRILGVERLSNSVIITFDDGKCAVYSAALLLKHRSQAELIDESELLEE